MVEDLSRRDKREAHAETFKYRQGQTVPYQYSQERTEDNDVRNESQ